MKANDPNALLARDANEAARAGLSYGAWRSLKDGQKLADKVHFCRAQQVAEIQRKRGEETCINASVATGRVTSPGTEWNIVVSATAHRHLNVSVIALRVSVEM